MADITSTGELVRFFRKHRCYVDKGHPITHTLLTKGRLYVEPTLQEEFYASVAMCLETLGEAQPLNPMMALSEVHTMVFPMFVDIDMEVDAPHLTLATKTRMAIVATRQFERFFEERTFRCVVCDKSTTKLCDNAVAQLGKEWVPHDGDDGAIAWEEEESRDDQRFAVFLERAVARAASLGDAQAAAPSRLRLTDAEYRALSEVSLPCATTRVRVGARTYRPSAKWKHGLHMHWPGLFVNYDRACQMRLSLINALQRERWPELQEDEADRIPWHNAVDGGVYNPRENGGGLRMVGAPKAAACNKCTAGSETCDNCKRRNNRCTVDMSSRYKLCTVVQGGAVDAEATAWLSINKHALLRNTTVRCWKGERETEPYAPYAGCPRVPVGSSSSSGRAPALRVADVSTSELRRHAKDQLLQHDATRYEYTTVEGIFPLGKNLVVRLAGDGATYCMNKQGCHGSSRVYMMVWRRGARTFSAMRCYCRKREVRANTGVACPDYKSPEKELHGDRALLFAAAWPAAGGGVPGGGGTASNNHHKRPAPDGGDTRAQVTMFREELERKRKKAEEAAQRVAR